MVVADCTPAHQQGTDGSSEMSKRSHSSKEMIFLGYDPGGKRGNGAAFLKVSGSAVIMIETVTLDSVDKAMEWFRNKLQGSKPNGVGIDAFLSWSTGDSGWRPQDTWLRKKYQRVQKSVLSSNSTYGAMAVQGMAAAMRIRKCWPTMPINETHPKILHYALWKEKYPDKKTKWPKSALAKKTTKLLLNKMQSGLEDVVISSDHEWDALISAWATFMGYSGKWKTDLMEELTVSEGDSSLLFPAKKAGTTFYWPEFE